jgi:PAS domain S-box-containing protein
MSRTSRLMLLGAWLALVLVGFLAISWMAREEIRRQEAQWESKLELLASSQGRSIGAWVAQRREALANLSGNLSLKLYMTELSATRREDMALEEPAQVIFLRNLIFSTAANNGFGGTETPHVKANIPVTPSGGLMLQAADGTPIVTSRTMPPLAQLPATLQNMERLREPDFQGPFTLPDNRPAVAFRQPVLPVQGNEDAKPIGQLLAVALLDERFYRQLDSTVPAGLTAEGLLVAWDDSHLTYFSPRREAEPTEPLTVKPGESDPATVAAIQQSGHMVSARDYREKPVFAFALPVENAQGWWLVRKIDRAAALGEAIQRARLWQLSYLLGAALVTAAALAMFRHQSALRAKESARHYRQLATRIERQEQLLTLIAETSPVATYILDAEERFRYANRRAAKECGMEREALVGKAFGDVVGAARAEPILRENREALVGHASRSSFEQEVVDGMPIRAVAREHIPLYAIPFGQDDQTQPGVLVLENDVTSLVQSQEKQQRTLSHLVRTVVAIVDKRDPHAAHHSACVSMIAQSVAQIMQLAAPLPETASIAGQLLNLGKILVPEELLTAKTIRDDDREKIRASLQATADLLQGIDFAGPVVETIRQSQECVDGSGPLGLKGDDILVTARIVHVANSFTALISPRAYRAGKSVDEALRIMLEGIDTQFDRAAVAALVTYVESGGGRTALQAHLPQAA